LSSCSSDLRIPFQAFLETRAGAIGVVTDQRICEFSGVLNGLTGTLKFVSILWKQRKPKIPTCPKKEVMECAAV